MRKKTRVPVCGGEIITTPWDMISRMKDHVYEFVQPDASVIGGFSALKRFCGIGGEQNRRNSSCLGRARRNDGQLSRSIWARRKIG